MLKGLYYPQTVSWSQEFLNYWDFVQNEAAKQGMVLFYETIWGEPRIIEDFEVFDLQCWVVPKEMAAEFSELWEDNSMKLYDELIYLNNIVTLEEDGIEFVDMPTYLEMNADGIYF